MAHCELQVLETSMKRNAEETVSTATFYISITENFSLTRGDVPFWSSRV